MTWFKLDDNFPDNPKVVAAVEDAGLGIIGLFVSAGCYCSRQETDGRFPKSMAVRFGATRKLVAALVTHGLWHDLGDYYEIHDFLEYNPSKAELDSKRKAKSMAGAMGAAKRWASVSHDTPNAPDPTRPVTKEISVSRAEPFDTDFEIWWLEYPRKIAKAEARKVYRARRREGIEHSRLMAAVGNYKQAKFGEDPKYVKHGASFLAKDGPWSEWELGEPEPSVTFKAPSWKPDEVRRCKVCANTGNYVKNGAGTACKVHSYG